MATAKQALMWGWREFEAHAHVILARVCWRCGSFAADWKINVAAKWFSRRWRRRTLRGSYVPTTAFGN